MDPAAYAEPDMQCEATRLMLAAKSGDRTAFDELVESVRGRAFHVARALVGSNEDAMELCQESFLKVYRARETFREGEHFHPWFHRVLRNTCYSFLRDKKRVRPMADFEPKTGALEDLDFGIVDDDVGPGDATIANERAQYFWIAFKGLSAHDREILALRHFKELSYKDISSALGIPQGTVMSRLFHARRRLRDGLDKNVFPLEEIGAAREVRK
ncbi:MAG: sigma-70 family RNA polymerase sigma factor [Planctomycetota bacterium]|nr:sigma-70 family RNA polymerase sigma factor [Planctomycetota bacterium]